MAATLPVIETPPMQTPLMEADGPVLIFGGSYSNLQATAAVLTEAERLGVPRDRTICTGDLAAYCADSVATTDCVRDSDVAPVSWTLDHLGLWSSRCQRKSLPNHPMRRSSGGR